MRRRGWHKVARRYVMTESGWLCVCPYSRKLAALYWVSDDRKVRQAFSRLTINQMLALQAALQVSIEALTDKEEEDASST